MDRHNSRAWTALAQLREKSGDYTQALANYQRSYSLNPFQPAVANRIATLNRSMGGPLSTSGANDTRTVQSNSNFDRY